ncbi:ABC transporter transmembrane domain-containing protein [Fretibacter rubidus]|uniref:ABC transporter transmembrane domain-containing protein n=1 Tax=Fretibacter rubidus TaxID=570162 RepID=UPI00352AAD34
MVDNADISGRSSGAAFSEAVEKDKAHRAKSRSLKPLRALWPFVTRYPGWLIGFLIFLILSAGAGLILPGILKLIVDCGFGGDAISNSTFCTRASTFGDGDLMGYFGIAVIFAVFYAAFGALRFFFITTLGQRVIADIRRAVYSKLLTLSPAFFERVRTGEVLSRLTTDTTLIETVITGSISFALRSIATIIGALFLMFVLSWKLSLMVLAIGPLIIVPAIIVGKRIRSLSRLSQDRLAEASGRGSEALTAVQTVQAFTREAMEDDNFSTAIEQSFAAQKSRITVQSLLTAMIFSISMISIFGILLYGASSVSKGTITGGDIAAFTGYAILVVSSSGALTETWTNLLRAAGASERLVEILETESEIKAPEDNAVMLKSVRGEIGFKDVNFAYPTRPDDVILKDITLTVAPGETVALVGPSGAGKSTIFQLLLRFYDVKQGRVTLDGKTITAFDPTDLRRTFAIVQQNTPLFSGSAMDNIRYGRDGASDAEVIEAAKAAYAHEFIMALPKGYETDLGERATTLSGGQRQRLAIARAILRDAPVLLLDEATSALDAESERAVQMAFEAMSKDRTTIVIAHRLATVKKADRIIVFDEGRMVGEGTHDSLIKDDGLYARLAALQFDKG